MKKYIKFIKFVLIVVIFILLLTACQESSEPATTPTRSPYPPYPQSPEPVQTQVPAPEPSKTPQLPINIDFEEYEYNDDDAKLYIKTNYLVTDNFETESIGTSLAEDIKNDTDSLDEWIRTQSVELPATDENYIRYGVTSIPEVTENSADFISLYIDYYVYTGGAHGNVTRTAYTYSSDGIRLINFLKLLNDGITLENVEIEINKQIKSIIEDMGPAFYNESIAFGDMDNLPQFYIKDGSMVIYFQSYEIAAYAYGIPEFIMPSEIFTY